MADTIERLEVLIEANTRAYTNAMAKLQKDTTTALKAATASTKELNEHMGLLGEGAKLALKAFTLEKVVEYAAKAAESIRELVKDTAELVDISASLGISTDALQALGFAAKITNTDFDALKAGLSIFNKNLGQASEGQGELFKVLKANHVALSGDMETDLRTFANLIQNAGNQEQRARLETIAFGKAGGDLNELFTSGAAGLDEFTKKAKDAGAIVDEKLLQQTADLDKAWNTFSQTLGNQVRAAILGTIGLLTDLAKAADDAAKKMPPVPTGATVGPDKSNPLSKNYGTGMAARIPGLTSRIPGMPGAPPIPLGQPGAPIMLDQVDVRGFYHGGGSGSQNGNHVPTELPPDPKIQAAEDAYNKLSKAIGLETKNLTASNREQFIANEAAKLGADATQPQIDGIKAVAAALYDQKTALQANTDAANMLADAMFTALNGIIDGSDTAAQALKKLVQQLLQAVLQAELLGTGPLAGLLGTAPKTAGSPAGLLGSLGSAIIGALPHFAGGGTLGAGQVGLVGERGPELIRGPASITPGRGGGGHVIVELVESPMLRGVIRQEATGVSVRITQSGISANEKAKSRQQALAA